MVQYQHTETSARKAAAKEAPGSAQEGRDSQYELVLAVSSIRVQAYGEDFQDFMHRGATQCSSCHAYIDLFCYQAPSSRCSPIACSPVHANALSMRACIFSLILFPIQRRDAFLHEPLSF